MAKKETELLDEMSIFEEARSKDAEVNQMWLYRLGVICIIGNAVIGMSELVFKGDAKVSLFLGCCTIAVGVISPLLLFIGCFKRYEVNVSAKSAVESIKRAYKYKFGVFKDGQDISTLAEKYTEIKEAYTKGKIALMESASKMVTNGE